MVDEHNRQRSAAGLPPLTRNTTLDTAAQGQAQDNAARLQDTHTGSDGSQPQDRIHRAGYTGGWTGENAAMDQGGVAPTMNLWMHSAGHRTNILRPQFKDIGVGLAQGRDGNTYWIVDFGGA